MRPALLAAVALAASGCLGAGGDGPAQTSLALEWTASPLEVKLIGLFAFDAGQERLSCDSYTTGEYDPFVDGEPAGIAFFAVGALEEGEQLLDGITTGSRLILAEAYDAGGKRIFLGCGGPVTISSNSQKGVDVTMLPDPSLEDDEPAE